MKKDKIPVAKEHFSAAFNITESSPDDGTFKGIAAAFGTRVDTWCPTVIAKGAFKKTIQENGKRFRILNQHDTDEPLARPGLGINTYDILAETDLGLMVGGKISKTSYGLDCITLLRDKVIDEMSIGHDPIRCDNMPLSAAIVEGLILDPMEWQDIGPESEVRVIRETRLWEASLVTWGANRGAMITDVNAMKVPPKLKPTMAKAKGSLKKAMDAHAEHIQDPAMSTAERQAEIMGHMEKCAASVDKCMVIIDMPEDGEDEVDNLDDILEKFSDLPKETLEIYVGKVLSSKTKEAILSCMKNLQALLDAAEPPEPPSPDGTQALTAQMEREQQLRELELAFV